MSVRRVVFDHVVLLAVVDDSHLSDPVKVISRLRGVRGWCHNDFATPHVDVVLVVVLLGDLRACLSARGTLFARGASDIGLVDKRVQVLRWRPER